jgi:hypothetical protein
MFGKNDKKEMKELEERIVKIENDLKLMQDNIYDKLIKIEKAIEPKQFKAIFKLFSDEDFEKLNGICSEIASKDESFIYDANYDDKEIILFSEDKDQLHKKSMWLVNKTGIQDLKYKVEPK